VTAQVNPELRQALFPEHRSGMQSCYPTGNPKILAADSKGYPNRISKQDIQIGNADMI
jgi:hypothetical protein